jgi:hypothetical protein
MTLTVGKSALIAACGVLGTSLWLAASGAVMADAPRKATAPLVAGAPMAAANEEIIITQLVLAAPEGSEDDIGEVYGLELLDWSTLTSLEMRIARYRVPRSKPVQSVLGQLRKDHRVISAEVSVQYAHPSAPSKDDSQAAVASVPAQASGPRTASAERAAQSPRTAGRDRVASVPTPPPPRRTETAADILAGGL